jgi:hypothetical protein
VSLRRSVLAIVQEGAATNFECRERLETDSDPGVLRLVAVANGGVGCPFCVRLASFSGIVRSQSGFVAVLADVEAVNQALRVPLSVSNFLFGSGGEFSTCGVALALLEQDLDGL